MTDVFISYSRRDKVFTQKLVDALKAANREVWADWDSIPAASDWDAEIKEGIEKTNTVLFLLSPEWMKSNECRKEMIHAIQHGKRLLPILYIMPDKGQEVPPELAKINWVYMRDTDNFDKAFETLQSAMDTDLDWIKTHTRVQVRAVEWDKKKRENSFTLRGKDLTDGEQFISGAAGKSPEPTQLQGEFVLASRKDATRRQRITLTGVTIALVVSVALGITAYFQRQEAIKQANVALSKQLAAQSQSIRSTRNSKQLTALLLAVQSYKISQSSDALAELVNNTSLAAPMVGRVSHKDRVTAIAISSDGKNALSGDRAGGSMLWETASGNILTAFEHTNSITDVAFSVDGKYAASASGDGLINVLNLISHEQLQLNATDNLQSIMFSPDGKYLASGGDSVQMWDVATGKEVKAIVLSGITKVMFTKDGKQLFAGGSKLYIWDISTWKEVASFSGGSQLYDFSESGDYFITETGSGVEVWSTSTGTLVSKVPNQFQDTSIMSVALSRDGVYAAMGDWDGFVGVWNVQTGNIISNLKMDSTIYKILFSPDGKFIATAGADYTARVWDIESGREISRMTHDNYVYELAFSADGKLVASGGGEENLTIGNDNSVRIWESGIANVFPLLIGKSVIASIAVSPDGKFIAAGNNIGGLTVWDYASRKKVVDLVVENGVYWLDFTADGKHLIGRDGTVYGVMAWDTSSWKSANPESVYLYDVSTLPYEDDGVLKYALDFSSDGKYAVRAGMDGKIRVYELESKNVVFEQQLDNSVVVAAFSPDGKQLATGDYSNTARVWDLASGQEVAHFTHDDVINSIAFSPDGKYIASASGDNIAVVWDAFTGVEISRKDHNNFLFAITFSMDGKHVLTGGEDQEVFVWDWMPEDLIANACKNLPRNLTREEWARYIGDAKEYDATCANLPIESELSLSSEPSKTDGRYIFTGYPVEGAPVTEAIDYVEVILKFENKTDQVIELSWMNFEGGEEPFYEFAPGEAIDQGAFESHAWRLRDSSGNLIFEYTATSQPVQEITINADLTVTVK